MKKRVLSVITAIAVIAASMFVFTACGGAKKDVEFEAMKSGKFYLDALVSTPEAAGFEVPLKITADGKNLAMSIDFMGMNIRSIEKDGVTKELNMTEKTYTVKKQAADAAPLNPLGEGFDKFVPGKDGKSKIKDVELDYKEYVNGKDAMHFFHKDNKFYALEVLSDGKVTATMMINEFKTVPDAAMFEVPSDFKEIKN